ncbi:MAG TPA: MMPL family transporter [Verrucomicrobiae bacterium]|nr:MMPL family transporter [Verrucomicrobiae bacterium]
MKRLTDNTLLARVLAWTARLVFRHRKLIIYSQVILFVLSVFITVKYLRFDTNRDNLVGQNEKYQHAFLSYKREFPQQDDLAVVVESENIEKNRQFIERLGAKVLAQPESFTNVIFNNDLKMLGRKALLFVPDSDLGELRNQLKSYAPFVEKFAQTTNLVSFFNLINKQFRTSAREENEQTKSLMGALPALERILAQADDNLHRSGAPPSPGVTALFDPSGSAETNIYVTYDNARLFVLSAQPRTLPAQADPIKAGQDQDNFNGDCVLLLRRLVAETQREVPGVNAGVTGMPVLDYDEMVQSQKDTTVASIVSLIICALIFIYGYNETGRPIKATICLVVGLAYTLAFATIVIGHVNILTVTFVPMLVGLAIDFGVHLITRYEEELRHGKTEEAALTTAMVFTGQGIFTGAFTTAGAFLAMYFTRFKGIQEMGLICGGGLAICFVPMMTLLPVLLLRGRQNVIDHAEGEPRHRAQIENLWLKRPGIVLAITIVLCALAATQIGKVRFDYNVLALQSTSLPSVQTEEKLIKSAGQSLLYGAVIADTAPEAVRIEQQITNLPAVASVQTMADYLVENPTNKLRLIGEIKNDLAPLHFKQPDLRPVDVSDLSVTLFSFSGYCAAAVDAIGTNEPALSQQFKSMRATIDNLRRDMAAGTAPQVAANAQQLTAYQQALFNDLRETFESLKNQDDSSALRAEDLPPALRNMFIGLTGKFLVQVYPKKDAWQRDNQKEFIDQLRQSLDPKNTGTPVITGMPVQLYEYTELLKDSYVQAAYYSLAAIIVLILFHFRSVSSVILSLAPVAIGSIWLGGVMGCFHVPLNPANIMILPLVIGIGVTNGIHILNRFAEEQQSNILARSTGKAVFVSGLTAIAGFGSLILAKDRGIHSLGVVMAAGVTACMIAALTFLPTLLNLMSKRPPQNKQPSVDNALSTLGQEEPR